MENIDRQVRQNVIQQLKSDPRIDTSKIYVHVRDGVVALSGAVTTFPIQLAMHKSVWLIPGVKKLNDYTVVGSRIRGGKIADDATLQRRIRLTLSRRNIFGFERVKVEVHGGWVVLSGWVVSYWQKFWLEIFSSEVSGVHGVTNTLTVKLPKPISDNVILENIMPLVCDRQRGDAAAALDVRVHHGTVKVSGVIHNLGNYQRIRKAIFVTPGVTGFDEHIRVLG